MYGTGVLILAAGKGTRMNTAVPKQFLEINGKPLYLYSVEKFLEVADILVVVTDEEHVHVVDHALETYRKDGNCLLSVCGGKERHESSFKGLMAIEAAGGCRNLLIHDAARCLIDTETVKRVLQDTEEFGAATAAVPAKDTIKVASSDGFVKETPDRSNLWITETPQGFRRDILMAAYDGFLAGKAKGLRVTDDAMLVETCTDCRVKLTMGSYENIKVTTAEDLTYIEERLR